MKKNQIGGFLNKLNTLMSRENMTLIYDSKGISRERSELYHDYVKSLMMLIFDTYMGDDIMNNNDRINHFVWCWNRNRDNFISEGIHIDCPKLKDKFLIFALEAYYPVTSKTRDGEARLLGLLQHVFGYDTLKSRADVDDFLNYYQLFENALKK